jgi:hypothetical protein
VNPLRSLPEYERFVYTLQPDIKHNRIPAPGFSFSEPNLPRLIEEIEQQP